MRELEQTDFRDLLFGPQRTALRVAEVAVKLGCSEQHVVNLIDSGRLGAIDIGAGSVRQLRVPPAEYEKFLRTKDLKAHPQ